MSQFEAIMLYAGTFIMEFWLRLWHMLPGVRRPVFA